MTVKINLNSTAQNDLLTEDAKVTPRSIRVFQKNTLKPNLNFMRIAHENVLSRDCLLYTSPSPRDLSTSRMPSSA